MVVVKNFLFIIMVSIIIFVQTFSLRRIRNFTKLLKANKVFANEWLMIAHLSCFCATIFCYIFYLIVYVRLYESYYIYFTMKDNFACT